MEDETLILEVRNWDGSVHKRSIDPDNFGFPVRAGEFIRPVLPEDDALRALPEWDAHSGTFRVLAVIHDNREWQIIFVCEFGSIPFFSNHA